MRRKDVFVEIANIISKNLFLDVLAVMGSQDTIAEKITDKNFVEYNLKFIKSLGRALTPRPNAYEAFALPG